MIELITNGALPRPAKCICCGYSGNDRWYFRFQSFIPRFGQILLCTTKYPDPDGLGTGCMNEASRRFTQGFMERREVDAILVDNVRLQGENDRLGVATNKFTDGFANLVASFLSDISAPVSKSESAGTRKLTDNEILDRLSGKTVNTPSQ